MSAVAEIVESVVRPEVQFIDFFRNAPVALAVIEESGTIEAVNPAFDRLLSGTSARKPNLLTDRLPSQYRQEVELLLSALFKGSQERVQFETHSVAAENQLLRWHAWLAHFPALNVRHVLVAVQDCSDVASVERRLQQAQRLETVGRLAGGVAHDFNNVMTGVLLYCDLLISALESGHRARAYADELRQAGIQATGLARQLLSVARHTQPSPTPISLNEVCEGMANLLRRLVGDSISLNFRLDRSLGLVKIDPIHAQQVLLNLVLNARDAICEAGHITVETGNCQVQILSNRTARKMSDSTLPCALFTVTDDGHGMDESIRAHIFEPFFSTKAGKGTGIGLSTVHDIVTTSGGLIHVDSTPGCGTRITILLPLISELIPESLRKNSFPVVHGDLLSFHTKDSTL